MASKTERIKELVELLNTASKAYYQKDTEIMSNLEYDTLYDELVSLERETGLIRRELCRGRWMVLRLSLLMKMECW